ncbi:MFS transporter [Mycoplasmatota bacterium]|nr:MFS transporter [Mycoplasmatota bacterium]
MKKQNLYFTITLSILLMICLGIVYSYSIFRLEIESVYQINKTLSGLPFMIVLLFYALSMAFSGILYDRFSSLYMSITGIFFISFGFILASFANDIYLITFSYGVLIGIGIGILYTLPLRVISYMDYNKKGLLTGLVLMGFGISPMISAPIVEYMLSHMGLSMTFLYLGIFYFICLTLLIIPLVSRDQKPLQKIIVDQSFLKNKRFYLIYILFFIATFIGLSMIGLTSTIGVEQFQISLLEISIWLGVFSIFNAIGRPLFGYINDRYSFNLASILSYTSIIIVSILTIFFLNVKIIFIISFIIFYINLGGWLSLAPAATLKTFGKEKYSQTYGFMFTAYGLGAFLGSGITSIFLDYFSYQSIYILIIFMSFIAMFFIIKIKKVE